MVVLCRTPPPQVIRKFGNFVQAFFLFLNISLRSQCANRVRILKFKDFHTSLDARGLVSWHSLQHKVPTSTYVNNPPHGSGHDLAAEKKSWLRY